MDKLELKTYPESCLRTKTNPAENFKNNLQKTLKAMADVMYVNNGIGLAATQVGIDASFIVVDAGEGLEPFVNPKVVGRSKRKIRMEEGCLSLPGIAVDVSRSEQITVKAQDENGNTFIKDYAGLMARVI
ncbi:MAG: peptide deformylase, partial [Candidatus Omnitrophota bacterium]